MTKLPRRVSSAIVGQLGRPHGLLGPAVARVLNRANGRMIAAAVDAAAVPWGGVVADIGFGGGLGLGLLLAGVGDQGTVYGVDIADDMLRRARARFAGEVGSDRLRLVHGSLTSLPVDDAALDAAITVNTVYFVTDLDAACAELARVLRPGARAVVGIGDPETMARMPLATGGLTIRSVSDIDAALRKAGLSVQQRYFHDVPLSRHLIVASRPSSTSAD